VVGTSSNELIIEFQGDLGGAFMGLQVLETRRKKFLK